MGGGGIEKTVVGNPIHITDALAKPVQALSIALAPIQDLNGYDSPWPAGGAGNYLSCPTAQSKSLNGITITTDGIGNYTINGTASDITNIIFDVNNATMPSTVYIHLRNPDIESSIRAEFYSGGTLLDFWGAASTNRVGDSTSVMGGQTVNKVGFQIMSGVSVTNFVISPMAMTTNTASGFIPYSNICPISGHTDADVWQSNKNLCYGSISGVNINNSGTIVSGDAFKLNLAYVKAGETYRVTSDDTSFVGGFFTSEPSLGSVSYNGQRVIANKTFVAPIDGYVVFRTAVDYATPQLELGSSQTDYVAHVGTTYPIPLGTTVYGGTLDVLTGVLTVTWAMMLLDGTQALSPNGVTSTTSRFAFNVSGKAFGEINIRSNMFYSPQPYIDRAGVVYGRSGNSYVEFSLPNDVEQTTAAAKQWFTDNPTQLCYELATPVTIQLTPQQVELLLGENNIWSDGTMTLTYLADGNASDEEALNILLGGRYVNNHTEDEPSDREALDILLGRTR